MGSVGERLRAASPYLLAGLLGGAGVTHGLRPELYEALVPPMLPGSARAWVYASGVLEVLVAATVAVPSTRRRGGLAAALLLVAVFPGNVWMAVQPGDVPRWVALARLPLQVPLVLWALQVADFLPPTRRRA